MKTLTLMTAFWQRPEISAIWWAATDRLRRTFEGLGWALTVSAVYSPDDPTLAENLSYAAVRVAYAAANVTSNRPLTGKMNMASQEARGFNPDYLMLMDSDDVFDDAMARGFVRLMERGVLHTGLRDFHFYQGGKLLYWPGYAPGHASYGRSIGCGRIYARAVAERVGWRIWEDSTRERGMDAQADRRMAKYGIDRPSIYMQEVGGLAVDLKSAANIWPLEKLTGLPGARFIDAAPVRALPEWPQIAALSQKP